MPTASSRSNYLKRRRQNPKQMKVVKKSIKEYVNQGMEITDIPAWQKELDKLPW